ncbi:MAG: DUF1957 domain-containing protein, partial [Candidatus Omnitrophica bacterium]|nr:DUF1957 domain-containing protein [Candidatus Omnitrophota bacterium]
SGYMNECKDNLFKRALNQAGREIVLAQSSDWAFIMKTGTMVPYAHKRVKIHINRFTRIYHDMLNNTIDEEWLKEIEYKDNIYSQIDCGKFFVSSLDLLKQKKEKVNSL